MWGLEILTESVLRLKTKQKKVVSFTFQPRYITLTQRISGTIATLGEGGEGEFILHVRNRSLVIHSVTHSLC
jgi:hypothetical protein